MQTADFDYHLPQDRIAQYPVERGQSRLLVVDEAKEQRHRRIADLPFLLRPGDLLVVNDTKVLPARLWGRRQPGGGRVEILLIEARGLDRWEALLRPGKRQKPGTRIGFDGSDLEATVVDRLEDGKFLLQFSEPVAPHLESLGHMPLPPYIQRQDEATDHERYQTVYADRPGAVAAPTAGLHFSTDLLEELQAKGIGLARITLHVGIGTFRPVSVERIDDHPMHSEPFEVSEEAAVQIARARQAGGRIVAVGTTVVRTLETLAMKHDGMIPAARGRSDLFIKPGFRFRAIDLLLTNFHLPRSTLLMLVCALGGQSAILKAYEEAVREGYRFYSYGDAMLIQRSQS